MVLGLGFVAGRLDADQLFTTAFLDELWQNEKWGRDFEAKDRQNHIRAELDEAARFLALLPGTTKQNGNVMARLSQYLTPIHLSPQVLSRLSAFDPSDLGPHAQTIWRDYAARRRRGCHWRW